MNFNFKTATFYRYGFTSVFMLIYIVVFGKYVDITHTNKLHWMLFFLIGLTTGSGAIFFDYVVNGSVLSPVQMVSVAVMVFAMVRLSG